MPTAIPFISFDGREFNIKKRVFFDIFSPPSNKKILYVFYCIIDKYIILDTILKNVTCKIEEYLKDESLKKQSDILYNSDISKTLYRCVMIDDVCYDLTHFIHFDKTDIKNWMDYCDKVTETTS